MQIVVGFGFEICDLNNEVDLQVLLQEIINCFGLVLIYVCIDVEEKVYLMVLLGVVNIEMVGE